MIPGMSDPADHARRPNNTPAPNTIGTIPSEAQAVVRCNTRKKKEEMKTATDTPWRCSIGCSMKARKPISSQIPADAAETTTATHHNHRLDASLSWRNALARATRDALGGPPPCAHHTKNARNIISITAASC